MENINQVIDKLTPMFQSVADKIGQGAGFGWEVVMRQQYVVAIGSFILFVGLGIVSGLLTWGAIASWKEAKKDVDVVAPAIFVSFLAILGYTISFVALYQGLAHLINPSYYALDFFINLVK